MILMELKYQKRGRGSNTNISKKLPLLEIPQRRGLEKTSCILRGSMLYRLLIVKLINLIEKLNELRNITDRYLVSEKGDFNSFVLKQTSDALLGIVDSTTNELLRISKTMLSNLFLSTSQEIDKRLVLGLEKTLIKKPLKWVEQLFFDELGREVKKLINKGNVESMFLLIQVADILSDVVEISTSYTFPTKPKYEKELIVKAIPPWETREALSFFIASLFVDKDDWEKTGFPENKDEIELWENEAKKGDLIMWILYLGNEPVSIFALWKGETAVLIKNNIQPRLLLLDGLYESFLFTRAPYRGNGLGTKLNIHVRTALLFLSELGLPIHVVSIPRGLSETRKERIKLLEKFLGGIKISSKYDKVAEKEWIMHFLSEESEEKPLILNKLVEEEKPRFNVIEKRLQEFAECGFVNVWGISPLEGTKVYTSLPFGPEILFNLNSKEAKEKLKREGVNIVKDSWGILD